MRNIVTMPHRSSSTDEQEPEYTFDFQEEPEEQTDRQAWLNLEEDWLGLIARVSGLCLLLFGLVAGGGVMLEAYKLYRNPASIEILAVSIEKGSNIDGALSPIDDITGDSDDFRLSYFVAWIIALSLLLLISMIAFSAIKTGGELVLYNVKIKKLASELPVQKK